MATFLGHAGVVDIYYLYVGVAMHLAGHVSVAGDVAVAVVADVAVDPLVQRPEGRDVRVRLLVNHSHLENCYVKQSIFYYLYSTKWCRKL